MNHDKRRFFMNREQAVAVIKEIFERCPSLEGKSIKLMPPKANNLLSNTFQVYIGYGDGSGPLFACVNDIAKRTGLEVKMKDSYCIIYKPYPNVKQTF